MISYELHTLKKHVTAKEWEIGSVFEDRELAIHEAKILDNSDRYAGMRVVAEDHNMATGEIQTSTIYRGGSNFKEAKAKVIEGTAGADKRPAPAPRAFTPRPRAAATDEKRSVMSLVPMLLLFLLIGIGGMYAVYELVPD
jgi:hypothetical protein